MLFGSAAKSRMIDPTEALPGRDHRIFRVPAQHAVLGTPLEGPWVGTLQVAYFGLGCFWGAERIFWQTPGVYSTAVGYQGGFTPNPTYEEVLKRSGYREVTTEIAEAGPFWYAEDYHQQYLFKNPNGYCGIGGTGVSCPVGVQGGGPTGA